MTKRIALGLFCVVVLAALAAGLVSLLAPTVYTVDAVQAGLRQRPDAWIGRTIRVRGWVAAYGYGRGCAGVSVVPAPPAHLPSQPAAVSTPITIGASSPCRATWLVLSSADPVVPAPSSRSRVVAYATSGPATLPVMLPPSARIPPLAGDGLAGILSRLPAVGPALFPEANGATLRVRLTIQSPACAGLSPCPSGTLVP